MHNNKIQYKDHLDLHEEAEELTQLLFSYNCQSDQSKLDKHDWVKQELHTKFWLENLIE
jgi:hypothetical protein